MNNWQIKKIEISFQGRLPVNTGIDDWEPFGVTLSLRQVYPEMTTAYIWFRKRVPEGKESEDIYEAFGPEWLKELRSEDAGEPVKLLELAKGDVKE